jgi:hypothetical protein
LAGHHDLTGKITLHSSLSYTYSVYDADYASGNPDEPTPDDNWDAYISFDLRASYQINRNNFVDIGFNSGRRDTDDGALLNQFSRSKFDIGWRVRL